MKNSSQPDIETICQQLFDALGDVLTWKWDDWVETILAETDVDNAEYVRGILDKFFPFAWAILLNRQ